jgi:hypothetical protein
MASFSWAIVCQRALVDQTGNVTLVQVLEDLGFPLPPQNSPPPGAVIPFPVAIVTHWKRSQPDSAEKQRGRLRLFTPAGKRFASAEFDIDLAAHQRGRFIAELAGIPYHGPGVYVVRVEMLAGKRWRQVGETEFNIHHNVPPAVPVAVKH